jgi:hypothetical protein
MRFFTFIQLSILTFCTISIFSCTEKKEVITSEPIADYIPLVTGKYIAYRLDSTVFTNFGRKTEVHAYQEKDVVDAQLTDNQGRNYYRMYRYVRDSAGLQAWQSAGSYTITPLATQIELTDDNLRVIKMHLPIKNGFSWKGNAYLPSDPYGAMFNNFSNDNFMDRWDFFYDGEPAPFSYNGKNYENVISVEQVNESSNVPIVATASYASMSRSVEKYSKTIGLIYKEYTLWEYQPNTGGAGGPYKSGFGIKKWMIDHN